MLHEGGKKTRYRKFRATLSISMCHEEREYFTKQTNQACRFSAQNFIIPRLMEKVFVRRDAGCVIDK